MSIVACELSERIGRALLASASDAILATDRNGVIEFWNPGAERIFGFSAGQAVGRSLDIIIPENLRARHWRGWAHALETGQSRYSAGELLSVPALTADGRRISVEFTIVILRDDDGRPSGVAAILRDVTTRFDEMRSLRRQIAERASAR
ncbi:MAG TPA: PAS domain S-box protein [Rhodoblastus sp.]|nr:PAS domain S-box protein [Rhodoblastus sp.]